LYLPWALQHGAGHLRLFELARVNPRRLNVTASGGPYLGCRSAAPESHPDSRPYTCRTSCGARRSGPSDLGCKAQASIAVADESAPTGHIELLPFLLRSSSTVELCQGIVDGSATSIPMMHVSEALATLVYRLVFDRATRAKELSVRVLVAQRLHHPRVAFPRPARHQRLRGG